MQTHLNPADIATKLQTPSSSYHEIGFKGKRFSGIQSVETSDVNLTVELPEALQVTEVLASQVGDEYFIAEQICSRTSSWVKVKKDHDVSETVCCLLFQKIGKRSSLL